jgi:hypothetical protein
VKELTMSAEHDAIMQDWRKNAEKHDARNVRFLHSLELAPDSDAIDGLAQRQHEVAFRKIDCTKCANCCMKMIPGFSDEDVDRISGHLGMPREAFIATYLSKEDSGDGYETKTLPCPFLGNDDRCTIYEVRPDVCRSFPHTDRDNFIGRIDAHSANLRDCPAVYYIVERMREQLR